jgi:predicted component of type VI protein secretion system
VCGGLAAMSASACTHPLDLFKVRLQLAGELDTNKRRPHIPTVLRYMLRTEGVRECTLKHTRRQRKV